MSLSLTLLLVPTAVFAVVLFVVRRLLTPTIRVKGDTNIPGPTEGIRWPILGDALWFWGAKDGTDLFRVIERLNSMQDKLLSFWLGQTLIITILDAKIMETIVSINKSPNKAVDLYGPITKYSDGVFTKNGKAWSDLRRPLDGFMHPRHTDEFFRIFTEKGKVFCARVGAKCGKGVFDLKEYVEYVLLDIALEAIFKVPGTQQIKDTMNVIECVPKCTEWLWNMLVKIQYKSKWFYGLSSLHREELEIKDKLRPSLKKIVEDSYDNMKKNGRDPADPDFVPENIVELSIHKGIIEKKPTEETVFSFYDVLTAAYDTSSTAMVSTILYLAMHPEYQEKAYQEQIDVMKDSLDAPSREELSRMNFLEMAFYESLRHISVPAIARTVSEEFKIEGYVFPEGATLYLMFHHFAHDPKYWERPKDFYPDHFLPEKVAKRPKGAFYPFGFGGRSCPGRLFAIQSTKLLISMLLRRFKFTTTLKYEELQYKYMIMVEFTNGYPVEVTPRVNLSEKA